MENGVKGNIYRRKEGNVTSEQEVTGSIGRQILRVQ